MILHSESVIFVGETEETLHLLRAAFANKINILVSHNASELKTLLGNQNLKLKAIIADCSVSAQKTIKKLGKRIARKHIPLVVSGVGINKEIIDSSFKNAPLNGSFNIMEQGRVFVEFIKAQPVVGIGTQKEKTEKLRSIKTPLDKRIFDILVSGIALLILSPLFLLVMLAIKLEDKGPAIYLSKRVGSGYRIFNLLKFRSMYTDADKRLDQLKGLNMYAAEQNAEPIDLNQCPKCKELGHACSPQLVLDGNIVCENQFRLLQESENGGVFMKFKNDPRITKVGKFLRNTSIDELPQLINVFVGHMSLVGNRPLPLYEAEQLTADGYVERFLAPAGLTGLWQVMQRGKEVSMEERIEMDNIYARNYSLLYDFKIILKTFPALFQQENV